MKKYLIIILSTCIPISSQAEEPLKNRATQTITAECTTEATGVDGVRNDCLSKKSIITAPDNFVFIQNGIEGGEISGNGDNHGCRFEWGQMTEVVKGSGITPPKTFSLEAYARSPSGHLSGRGWASCSYTLSMTAYN